MPPSLLASPYPSSPLVSVAWLQTALGSPDLVILDASMAPPGQAKYVPAQIIPGARRFDFDQDFCDQESRLPHMMPSASDFTRKARQLGIQQNSVIVVYDHLGLFASPRAWWMFKSMGAAAVFVLDGGLPAWLVAGLSSTTCYGQGFPAGDFSARYQQRYCVDRTQVLAALDNPAVRIFDARPSGRFEGAQGEPRPGLRSGHMPGAISMPFTSVQQNGFLLPPAQLGERLGAPGAILCTCGSGVTACVLALAAEVAGFADVAVYDGSWSEWGDPQLQMPVVTGPA